MLLGEGQDMKTPDELAQIHRLPVKQQLFSLLPGDRYAHLPHGGSVFNFSLESALLPAVLNALFRVVGTKTPAISEQIHRFQEICLSLPVPSE
jgi:hypothetical protein